MGPKYESLGKVSSGTRLLGQSSENGSKRPSLVKSRTRLGAGSTKQDLVKSGSQSGLDRRLIQAGTKQHLDATTLNTADDA